MGVCCGKREDLGKIQGRSIDLGECGVQECWWWGTWSKGRTQEGSMEDRWE